MLLSEAYTNTWSMCLASFLFFVAVAAAARWVPLPSRNVLVPPKPFFWGTLLIGFAVLAVCLTLIDKPHVNASETTLEWMFMFSAFLGIPVSLPFLGAAAWALAYDMREEPAPLSELGLVGLASFAIGCAASNVHDIAWCGAITEGFTKHHAAGYDLDYFVGFGRWFGISREVLADYATLGPYAIVLVTGELLVAATALIRLRRFSTETEA